MIRSGLAGPLAESRHGEARVLRVRLLGGFHAERTDCHAAVSNWQRRSAKSLIKLLAAHRGHALHREQVLDLLWPNVDADAALNGLGKALHAARRAIEPELAPRQTSRYLRLTDSMLALDGDNVAVDVDRFEHLATIALRSHDLAAYESALDAYGGVLLPEDRYEDWCSERREFAAELRRRLLLALADVLEERGALAEATVRLREVLYEDASREDTHRRLMRLYAAMGMPDQAARQFHVCEGALRRELDLAPQQDTVSLYEDLLANRPSASAQVREPEPGRIEVRRSSAVCAERAGDPAFVGREQILDWLSTELLGKEIGTPGLIVLSGEAGVGKTRLLREFARSSAEHDAVVLWGGGGAHARRLAYGPFALALEGYVASRSEAERNRLLALHPALAALVPSLGDGLSTPASEPEDRHLALAVTIVRLLSDLSRDRPLLLVLGDLHDADPASLDLLCYLAHVARQRRWLIVGALRAEELEIGGRLHHVIEETRREQLCRTVDLPCLTRDESGRLVAAMLAGHRLDEKRVEEIHTYSRGNPLFVAELVGQLRKPREGPRDDEQTPAAGHVPPRVKELANIWLAAMGEPARRVIELAAAVDAHEISLGTLRAAAAALDPPVSSAALYDALDCAIHTRLLEERSAGYAFRHPLVRFAVDESLSQHRRDQLHRALRPARTRGTAEVARKSTGSPTAHPLPRRPA
jgi:DNA-binding SARP family transcriptional activator